MNLQIYLKWESLPLCLLTTEQQIQFKTQSEIRRYKTGEIIWSTGIPGKQFLIVSGKVRLKENGKPNSLGTLEAGDWFGDLLELSGDLKAVASKNVEVMRWDAELWQKVYSLELNHFWQQERSRYQSIDINLPQPVSGYPFVLSPNTAAACLTMAAQYLQNPIPFDSVQRQLRGERPHDVMEAGEKLGLQVRQLQVTSNDLRSLTFPALLLWRREEWIVIYGVRGNRLIIAFPTNLSQTCQSIPQKMLEENWDGQLWQVELIQEQDNQQKFNLSWFVPAVWKHWKLLGEVLLLSLALQLLGLATPIITQYIIDKVMVFGSRNALDVMAIALLGVAIFEAILGILRLFIFTHTANRLDLSLSSQLFRQLMRLPLTYFESRRVGDTVARAQELENIRSFLTGTALTVILDSIFSVVYLVLMFAYSVTLTWVALAVIPLFVVLNLVATPILRHCLNETFNRGADNQSFLVETVTLLYLLTFFYPGFIDIFNFASTKRSHWLHFITWNQLTMSLSYIIYFTQPCPGDRTKYCHT
ncbi:ABC transporter transmembrane domain-containing protein [uncultured Nostoc sp.]|uniref:ABC transporter transmembrane domain-containing protein n=1 Tax=uncultured Nostoc sp. TaxID=340711 RepID=UPI0035CC2CD5|nr:cyclic nucleotide-binding domain-containing protein [Nostoc sp. NMS8]